MVQLDTAMLGPADAVNTPYHNPVEVLQAKDWYALGGIQGVIDGMVPAGVAGAMSIDVPAGACLVSRRDGSNNVQKMGYLVPTLTTTRVPFGTASAAIRNDALVCAVVDTSDGPVGSAALPNGGHLVVVPGVSGTSTPRTDTQISAYLGRGGYVRLADVPIASTDTQINMANIVKPSPYNVVDSGWINLTPTSGTGTFQYRVKNGYVNLLINLSGLSIPVNTFGSILAAGGLPAAYRPVTAAKYEAGSAAGSFMSLCVVGPDGSVGFWNPIYNSGSLTVGRATVTWPIG